MACNNLLLKGLTEIRKAAEKFMREPWPQLARLRQLAMVSVAALAVATIVGCKKKQAAAAPENAPTAEADTNAAPGAAPAAVVVNPDKPLDLTPIHKAMSAGNFDKAAEDLLALQKASAQMSQQQQMVVVNQMRSFQRSLSSAVSSGNPNAIAAANRLREASMHH